MYVGPEPRIVGKIPAHVIGIFIDYDGIGIPEPAIAVLNVVRRNTEVEPAEPEPRRATACQVIDVTRAKAAREVAMLPGMVQVIVGIVRTGIVADPAVIRVNMRGFRVPWSIAEIAVLRSVPMLFGNRVFLGMDRSRTMSGDVSTANFRPAVRIMPAILRKTGEGEQENKRNNCS